MSSVIPIELTPAIQHYSWGKRGKDSLVARLTDQTTAEPFAELWLGSHPDGPVEVVESKMLLSEYLALNNLPPLTFLFKVLSVGNALSIQTHPTIEQAKQLHQSNAKQYPDNFSKPEASVALTKVELLYGFRPAEEIRNCVIETEGLAQLLNNEQRNRITSGSLVDQELIKEVFSAVMHCSSNQLATASCALKSSLEQQSKPLTSAQKWICKLQPIYPADPGIFCFLLLNFVELEPGQSLFIAPGVVHAYLSGDMLECMANSNNVVRAGLTQKFCDVETLLNIAQLTHQPVSLTQSTTNSPWQSFHYPADEFSISLLSPTETFTEGPSSTHQIWLCLEQSKGTLRVANSEFELSPGKAYLLPSTMGSYSVTLTAGQVARAMAPLGATR